MKTLISLLVILGLGMTTGMLNGATRTFQTSGNWSQASNWQGGNKPGTGDDVIIAANCTVDENIGLYTFTSITVNNAVFLYLKQYPLQFTGAVSNAGFISTECTTNTPLPAGKSWGSYVYFDGTGAQTVPSGTYYVLKFSATGVSRTVTASGHITVTHQMYVEGFTNTNEVTFDLGTWQLRGAPQFTFVMGRLRTANTSTTPLPSGMRWYSVTLGKQGTMEFYASSPQYVPGGIYDDDLVLANSTKTLTGIAYSNGVLTLSQAVFVIVDSNVVIGTTGSIVSGTASFSPTSMVATMGSGALVRQFNGGGSFTYPIGDLTGTAEYSPVSVTFPNVAGSFLASAKVTNAKHPQNSSTASYINRYWTLDLVSTVMRTGNATFSYVDADVVGPEDNMYTGQWLGSQWYQRTIADTLLNRLSATGVQLTGDFTGYEVLPVQSCIVDTRVALQGAAVDSTGYMRTTLQSGNRLPLQQPYGAAPWNYSGNEQVPVIPSNTVVDWILLELRSSPTGTAVARRAAFLLSSGIVVDTNGAGPVGFPTVSPGAYYLVVRHRNHLAVMSSDILQVSPTTPRYDFTSAQGQAWGSEPMTGLQGGQAPFALWSGDANADGRLRYIGSGNDPAAILTRIASSDITASVSGYFLEDTDLNGVVKYSGAGNDRAPILRNIGGMDITKERTSQVP
ncbi:MAG: hypothetical protein JXA28_14890 [Bacteroidetes bacterium]|nr:hypothetical protein [Bacteroidota bacterium]